MYMHHRQTLASLVPRPLLPRTGLGTRLDPSLHYCAPFINCRSIFTACIVRTLIAVQELIGLDAGMLADTMTVSVSVTRGETIRKHLNKEKAEGERREGGGRERMGGGRRGEDGGMEGGRGKEVRGWGEGGGVKKGGERG